MHSEQDLLDLAAKSGKNDLAFLIKAKEAAKLRMSEDPSPENVRAFNTAKDAVEAEAARLQAAPAPAVPALTFAKQLAAVDWLKAQGFKIGKSKFNADVKGGKVHTNIDGHFDAATLLAYAAVHLVPLARAEHSGQVNASANKLAADAELKVVQTERQKLKLQREQGLLMLRSERDAELGARALFFKNEIEGFGLRCLPELIQLVGGREDSLQEALAWWEEHTADLMDAWSQDREFGTDDDEPVDAAGEELADLTEEEAS